MFIFFFRTYRPVYAGAELHFSIADRGVAVSLAQFGSVKNAYASYVTGKYLGYSCFRMSRDSKFVTIEDCECLKPVSRITGGRRYAFNVVGQYALVRHCHADEARH